MSERRPPDDARQGHPDEALAAFTDGAATQEERALVLAHLQGCAACRNDVEMARRAVDALAAVPEPDSPTLDPESIVRRAGNVVGIEPRGVRGARRRPGAGVLAGGLAAGLVAAGLVFVLATGAIKLGGGGASNAAGGGGAATGGLEAPAPTEAHDFTLAVTGANYSRDSIDRLAAAEAGRAAGKTAGASASPVPSPSGALLADRSRAATCTDPQTTDGSRPLSVVLARFDGRPAFVSVLRRGGGDTGFIRVVVTDRRSCAVLYEATASVPQG